MDPKKWMLELELDLAFDTGNVVVLLHVHPDDARELKTLGKLVAINQRGGWADCKISVAGLKRSYYYEEK